MAGKNWEGGSSKSWRRIRQEVLTQNAIEHPAEREALVKAGLVGGSSMPRVGVQGYTTAGWGACQVQVAREGYFLPGRRDAEGRRRGRSGGRMRRGCTGVADTVHHVVGRAVTGDDPKYLVAACHVCNGRVGEPGKRNEQCRPRSKW